MPAQANSFVRYPWTDFGTAFTEPTYVRITVSGQITANYGPNTVRFGSSAGTFWRNLDARGWYHDGLNSCGASVSVGASASAAIGFCIPDNNYQPLLEERSMTGILNGQPKMFRLNGPWLAGCNDRIENPCFVFEGSQTVTIVPIADKLRLTASKNTVKSGEVVTFTASTSNGAAFTVREWIWVEDSPPITVLARRSSGERPKGINQRVGQPSLSTSITPPGCALSSTCTMTVTGPGTMYVRAWVVSKAELASANVSVEPPDLIVYCSGDPASIANSAPIVRTDNVTCVGRLSEPAAFELTTLRTTAGADQYTLAGADLPQTSFNGGDSVVWSGSAIISSSVDIEVRLLSTGQNLTASGSFTVTPRSWSQLLMPPQVNGQAASAPPLSMSPPLVDSAGYDIQPATGALGMMRARRDAKSLVAAFEGPNAPWHYSIVPPTITDLEVFYSNWLDDNSTFAQKQHKRLAGEPMPAVRQDYCELSHVTTLRHAVLQHEGAAGTSGPSHYSEEAQFLASSNIAAQMESFTVFSLNPSLTSKSLVVEAAREAFWKAIYLDPIDVIHKSFDTQHPVPMPNCKFRY